MPVPYGSRTPMPPNAHSLLIPASDWRRALYGIEAVRARQAARG